MGTVRLTRSDIQNIDKCVVHFIDKADQLEALAVAVSTQLQIHREIKPLIHFIKHRVKDQDSLRHKLVRKELERKKQVQANISELRTRITAENLLSEVNDLAGVRLIHLHTQQFATIHRSIIDIIEEQQWQLIGEPIASCWDVEYRTFYEGLQLRTRDTDGYSSVHYVLRANTRTDMTCELQVRTLTDEVWGEVSHRVNYPDKSPSTLCDAQLKTLARFTTGCTRLVDSIFESDAMARR